MHIHATNLKPALDRLYDSFNIPDSAIDPIHIVRRYARDDDRELVGFCAASLAFGRVGSVIQSIERVVARMGPRPADFVRRFDPERDGAVFQDFVHRWIRGADIVALLWLLHQMLERSGSLEDFFLEGDDGGDDIRQALDSFSRRALALDIRRAYGQIPVRPGVCYFFPRAAAGSGCKRLNLFMRWMVRRDALDLGVWTRVSPSRLIIPLDTHIVRIGRCLKLTRYSSPGLPMAIEITAALRALDPADPVRYDFSICHIGMMNACGFRTTRGNSQCPLKGFCSPRRRKGSRDISRNQGRG